MKFAVVRNGSSFRRFVSSRLNHCYRQNFSVYLWETTNRDNENVEIMKKSPNDTLSKVNHLSCGHGFTVASTRQQSLLVSGVNANSQLGLSSAKLNILDKFKEIELPLTNSDSKILGISCGRLHTVVLTSEGLFAAGCNCLGQCGLGKTKETASFTKIDWLNNIPVNQAVCGLDHTLLLMNNGSVWSSGWGADGQTGLGHTNEQQTFAMIKEGLDGVQIKKLASKADSCLALSNCGKVFAWGNSEYDQVGFSAEDSSIVTPTRIGTLENIVDIAVGATVGMALTDEGKVLSWGYGLLGNSSAPYCSAVPENVTYFEERVVSIACGLDFYVAVTESGKLYIWGRIGCRKDSGIPKQVSLTSKVVRVICGIDHMGIFTEN